METKFQSSIYFIIQDILKPYSWLWRLKSKFDIRTKKYRFGKTKLIGWLWW